MRRLILCIPFLAVACDGKPDPVPVPETCGLGLEPYIGEPETFRTVDIWAQDDPDLAKIDVKEGCEIWLPMGVQCEVAPAELAADVRVYAVTDPCHEDPGNGGYVLATAEYRGKITVYLECLRELFETEPDGSPSREVLKLVVGHEVGHESGMWWHVPATCDDSAAKDDFEKDLVRQGVCGPSLMNPMLDPNVCFITDLDAQAYDLRDPSQSAYGFKSGGDGPDGCVLTYRPAP